MVIFVRITKSQMKITKSLFIFLAVAAVLASCKKEEETPTYKAFTGSFAVGEMPSIVNPGMKFHFEVSGDLALSEDETDKTLEIVYTFQTSEMTKADTVRTFDLVIPDKTGEYSLTARASAKGYTSKTISFNVSIYSEKSITGADKSSLKTIRDTRDSRLYHTTTVGGRTWMADNLAYYAKDGKGAYTIGYPYLGEPAAENITGAFYTWSQAMEITCPTGYRIPTVDEWRSLGDDAGKLMVDAYFNGKRMWDYWPEVRRTNAFSFFAYPFGYASVVDGEYSFKGFGDYAFYWADDNGQPACCYLFVESSELKFWTSPSNSDFAAQIRCIKE